jgi:uncharacterized protein (TIGR00369 family)
MTETSNVESSNATIDELAGHCFGCGPANPEGLHLSFTLTAPADGLALTATARFSLTRLHEGAPGFVHGGIIATLLDEAMSKLNRPLNALAMTRHMEVDYLRPAPVGEPLVLVGRHVRRDGRKLFHEAELQRSDGSVLARGKGLFIVLDADRVAAARMHLPVAD